MGCFFLWSKEDYVITAGATQNNSIQPTTQHNTLNKDEYLSIKNIN